MNSLQLLNEKGKHGRKGYWSNRHSSKWFRIHEKRLKLEKDEKTKYNFYELKDPIYDSRDRRWVKITVCNWFGRKLILHKMNIIENKCDGSGKVKRIIPRLSHTSYSGEGISALLGFLDKSIYINQYETDEVDCLECKNCKGIISKIKKFFNNRGI